MRSFPSKIVFYHRGYDVYHPHVVFLRWKSVHKALRLYLESDIFLFRDAHTHCLLSGQGPAFTAKVAREVFSHYGKAKSTAPVRITCKRMHMWSDAIMTLARMLSLMVNESRDDCWDVLLPHAAYGTQRQSESCDRTRAQRSFTSGAFLGSLWPFWRGVRGNQGFEKELRLEGPSGSISRNTHPNPL